MSLFQIALRNLSRRKAKIGFMLLGLMIGSATVVSIYSIITAMQSSIDRQLSDMGANLIITADSGELSFQYGGVMIPELVFDTVILSNDDLESIDAIPSSHAVMAKAPKLVGTITEGENTFIIAGIDLPAEFEVKPWLRFHESHDDEVDDKEPTGGLDTMEMDFQRLNLERVINVKDLLADQVVLGTNISESLGLKKEDRLTIAGKSYEIIAVFEETGSAEDNQIFFNLEEARQILNRPNQLTVIELSSDFRLVNEDSLIAQLQQEIPHARITGIRQAVMSRNELLNNFSRFGYITGAIIFLTGSMSAATTMTAAVRERTREIGIFRAVGFRKSHIYLILLTETALISLVGGIAGYHLGLISAGVAGPLLAGTTLENTWNGSTFLLATFLTITVGLLAGLYPAAKAANLDPAEALRFM